MDPEFFTYLNKLAHSIDFREGPLGIKKIIVEVHRHGKISVRDLGRVTRISPAIVSLVLAKLSDDGLIHRDEGGSCFTLKGMRYVEEQLGIRSLPASDCECCEGSGVGFDVAGIHSDLFASIKEIETFRPDADVTFDQAKCTIETVCRRLLFLHRNHAFDGTRILFLGDDDFISIASCSPIFIRDFFIPLEGEGDCPPPFDVTAVDVDDRIIASIQQLAERWSVESVHPEKYDCRDPLPPRLVGEFDVAFTDPPYTVNGCKLFLSRAVAALRPVQGCRIFLSLGHIAMDDLAEIQRAIIGAGLVIEQVLPGFNMYEGGNIIGNHSMMMVLATGPEARPPVDAAASWDGSIYTAGV